jgi:hypothetical protein
MNVKHLNNTATPTYRENITAVCIHSVPILVHAAGKNNAKLSEREQDIVRIYPIWSTFGRYQPPIPSTYKRVRLRFHFIALTWLDRLQTVAFSTVRAACWRIELWGRMGSILFFGCKRSIAKGEVIFFFDLCDFTLCECSLDHNCHINRGAPVPPFPEIFCGFSPSFLENGASSQRRSTPCRYLSIFLHSL